MTALFDPEKIERDLRLLEREYSLTETRTVLFNLVIFTDQEDISHIEEALLRPLLGKRAVRIIRISLGHSGETTVSVSARCAPDQEDRGVCFQEILIENGSDECGGGTGDPGPLSSSGICPCMSFGKLPSPMRNPRDPILRPPRGLYPLLGNRPISFFSMGSSFLPEALLCRIICEGSGGS